MNKLKEAFANLETVKRIHELENYIDKNVKLNQMLIELKTIQRKLVLAKEYKHFDDAKIFKQEYDKLYAEILDFPFVEEYLELLDETNQILLNITNIIERKINEYLK